MKRAIIVTAVVALCIAPLQNARAESNLGLERLGVEAGLVDLEAGGSTLGLGAVADLGTLARDVRLSSQLGYWSKSEGGFGAEASIRDISIGARARYLFHVSSPNLQPYAGAGLGLHFYRAEVVVPDMDLGGGIIVPGFTSEDSSTKLGLDMGGGMVTPLNPKTDLFFDLWYTLSDVDQLAMKVGVSFKLAR